MGAFHSAFKISSDTKVIYVLLYRMSLFVIRAFIAHVKIVVVANDQSQLLMGWPGVGFVGILFGVSVFTVVGLSFGDSCLEVTSTCYVSSSEGALCVMQTLTVSCITMGI